MPGHAVKNNFFNIMLPLLILATTTQAELFFRIVLSAKHAYAIIVFPVNLILLLLWCISVKSRVTNKSIKRLFYAELAVIFSWICVRVLQKEFFYSNDMLMRNSGYFIVLPLVILPLAGLYNSIYIGRNENFKLPKPYYLMIIPAFALIMLMLTNDIHSFVFTRDENNSVLQFHANWGIFLVAAWAIILKLIQILELVRYNKASHISKRKAIIPVFLIISMFLTAIPYFLFDFSVKWEPVEFTTLEFFIEYMVWECCIQLGLFPVNSDYDKMFYNSTIAMQILDINGVSEIRSKNASVLTRNAFMSAVDRGMIFDKRKLRETHLGSLKDGHVVWEEDVSELHFAINELKKANKELKQESVVLQKEIALKSESVELNERNELYNELSKEIHEQLEALRSLLEKCKSENEKQKYFPSICIIGIYIKRYCNLRLNSISNEFLDSSELEFCLYDILKILVKLGVRVSYKDNFGASVKTEHIIFFFGIIEKILEALEFDIDAIDINLSQTCVLLLKISGSDIKKLSAVSSSLPENYCVFHELSDTFLSLEVTCENGGTV